MPRPARALAILAVPLAAGLLGGCGFASPIQTQQTYAASDGVRVQLSDDVRIENLLLLTAAEGEPGRLLGAVVNGSGDDATVSIDVGGEVTEVHVAAGQTANLADEEPLAAVGAAPGATIEVSIEFAGTTVRAIPVLDGTIPPYDEYLP